MIKSISFREIFIRKIKTGRKTVTRRIKTGLKEGDICYFKVGRFGRKKGYLRICNIIKVKLHDIYGDVKELHREGFIFGDYDIELDDFIDWWNLLNDKKNYRWKDNPDVYRIRFKYLGENIKRK